MSEIEEEVIMENEKQSGEKDDEKEDNEEQFEEDIQENRKDLQEETEETNDEILDPDSGLTEAEREFRRVEQEQLGKQQKVTTSGKSDAIFVFKSKTFENSHFCFTKDFL